MRFDDRLATVLAREPDRPAGRITMWRQLMDLLAQVHGDDALMDAVGARLAELAREVPVAVRRDVAAGIAVRTPTRIAVALIAADVPGVAGAMLSRVGLSGEDWIAILPRLSPTGRGFLRHRRDLPAAVTAALASFGASDLRLAGAVEPDVTSLADRAEPDPAAIAVEKETRPIASVEAGDADAARAEPLAAPEPASAPSPIAVGAAPLAAVAPDPAPAEAVSVRTAAALNADRVEDELAVQAAQDDRDARPADGRPEPSIVEAELPAGPAPATEPGPLPVDPGGVGSAAADLEGLFATNPEYDPRAVRDAPAMPFDPDTGEGQIRAIISRIARYRRGRDETGPLPLPVPGPAESFLFECGIDGVIRWVEGVPRSALIGETIAAPAGGQYGVDAHAPGAFRRRAPFRDARLQVAGEGPAGGEWRIAGVPVFCQASGRFQGYRGTARRPRAHERAEPAAAPGGDTGSADSLRQLVHELRTPLNAIGGFAEMIRRQMRGPVGEAYRDRAGAIAGEANRLLVAVDDLDLSARLDSARLELSRGHVDVRALVVPICADHADATGNRPFCIAPAGLPAASGDPGAIRRMVARLLAAAASLAAPGEDVAVRIGLHEPGRLSVRVTRPARLAGVADAALFDPGYGPAGDWPDAPLLGLGFSLHLVRRLASAVGGQLTVDDAWFALLLPAAADAAEAG